MSPTHGSAASTRTRSIARTRVPPLLESGQRIVSSETKLAYRIDRLIGEGGFGRACHRITLLNETQFWRLAGRRPIV